MVNQAVPWRENRFSFEECSLWERGGKSMFHRSSPSPWPVLRQSHKMGQKATGVHGRALRGSGRSPHRDVGAAAAAVGGNVLCAHCPRLGSSLRVGEPPAVRGCGGAAVG